MKAANVPVIPGSDGLVEKVEHAREIAMAIGYPIIIKATAGGGGKGMRVIHRDEDLEKSFITARNEAEKAFGNPGVYIEKYLDEPRHIEIQILGDQYGNIIHLGERDCTIQRRHQKLIEESPSPIVNSELRAKMGEAGVRAAKAINYEGAGTVEFLVDKHHNFYFMEMNTRIQVEHPVTEEIYDIDLIKQQILIASGKKLPTKKLTPRGHAIECRINAEDPDNDFRPSAGELKVFHVPGGHGVRVETHAYAGYRIPPYYDSMIAKLIVYAHTRDEAIERMLRALDEFIVEGIKTTIPLHKKILQSDLFRSGRFDTSFLEKSRILQKFSK
jgi:acetyl-CoA carboxylase biotin carboxylase subunit